MAAMRPHLRSRIAGTAAWHIATTDNKFFSSAPMYSSSGVDANVPAGGPPPLAIKISTEPNLEIACSTNWRPPAAVETSQTNPIAPCPITATAASTLPCSREQIATRTPALASERAVASPSPADAAATAAVFPLIP